MGEIEIGLSVRESIIILQHAREPIRSLHEYVIYLTYVQKYRNTIDLNLSHNFAFPL